MRSLRSRGFTLIELLVVVAIIALLIAILLPSLSRAKKQSSSVACGSNLRQFGIATVMYAEENNGTMALQAADNGWQYYWMDLLNPYMGENETSDWLNGGRKVMFCPSGQPAQVGIYHYPSYGYSARIGKMPFYLNGGYPMYNPRKLYGCSMPAELVYMMDTSTSETVQHGSFDFGADPLGTKTQVVGYRDMDRTNNLYADGHVDNVDILPMTDYQTIMRYSYWSTWPESLWE